MVIYTFPDDTLRIVLQLYGDFITSPDHVSARLPLSQLHILESSVRFCFYAPMVQRVKKPEGSSFSKVNAQI